MTKKITKADLIKMLQEDSSPMDAPVRLSLECTNDDSSVSGEFVGVRWSKGLKALVLDGEYEEDGY